MSMALFKYNIYYYQQHYLYSSTDTILFICYINYISKMSNLNEQWFLKGLTDFSDMKVKKQEFIPIKSRIGIPLQFDLQLESNEKLLKSFKQMKQKLKESNRNNQLLGKKILQKQNQIERLKEMEKDIIKKMHDMSRQNSELKNENKDFSEKINYARESVRNKKQLTDELQLYKMKLSGQIEIIQNLQKEKQKTIEISINQKLQLEEQIHKLQIKSESDRSYVQDMQVAVSKIKTRNIELQNELKKIQIKYDQELYNKKWLANGYQKEQLQISLKQLQKQYNTLSNKLNREKDKRSVLQKRVLQLEQTSGLWSIKSQTYLKQVKALTKKVKKLTKQTQQAQLKAEQSLTDCLFWEQKFLKSITICEELSNRVKRDLIGDVVSLAKTCQYKLNKLKEQQRKNKPPQKSPSAKKSIQKSKSKSNIGFSNTPTRKLFDNFAEDNTTKQKVEQRQQKQDRALTETKPSFYNQPKFDQKIDQIITQTKGRQNSENSKYSNLQIKIRKQRQVMERKIRQKMLYNRIDVTTSSPQKHYLRSQYLKLMNI